MVTWLFILLGYIICNIGIYQLMAENGISRYSIGYISLGFLLLGISGILTFRKPKKER